MWAYLAKLEAEFPGLKGVIQLLVALGVGFSGGLWFRNDQVTFAKQQIESAKTETASAKSLINLRDAEIAALQKQLSEKAITVDKRDPEVDQTDKSEKAAPVPPKIWPKGNPENEIVETSKPEDESPSFKTMPMPTN